MKELVYIVTSREVGPVFVTKDKDLAETKKLNRIAIEEMQGGKPSVYIVQLELKK
jgi:hypothetical protein